MVKCPNLFFSSVHFQQGEVGRFGLFKRPHGNPEMRPLNAEFKLRSPQTYVRMVRMMSVS